MGTPLADAARTITSIGYQGMSKSGGMNVTCTPDGAADISYFNPGFSSAGAEVVQRRKTLAAEQRADLWSAAAELARSGAANELPDASWNGSATITLVLSDGTRTTYAWPEGGAHEDPRVVRLAGLLRKLL